MYSLFKVQFPWGYYVITLAVIWALFPQLNLLPILGIAVFLHQFLLLFNSIGHILPIRYLFGLLMSIQMLVGPTLAYYGLDEYQRYEGKMKIPEFEYFSYVLPAVCFFILGLHFHAGKLKGEVVDITGIRRFINKTGNLPAVIIGIGFVSSLIRGFFGAELGFVFYLLSSFKFIGLFMLILGERKIKLHWLLLVFGSILLTSIKGAMFHDLITWIIMLGSVLAIKYKPSTAVKAIITAAFLLLVVIIQLVKGDYRKATWNQKQSGSVDKLEEVLQEKNEDNGFFDATTLAKSSIRINQGYIITNIMSNVPARIPYSYGEELMEILEAAFLPRVLAPDKLKAGDRFFFMKWSGMQIAAGTSMGLSPVGDGYINFGPWGGCVFMFVLALIYSFFLNGFHKYSRNYPALLLFTPMVFYYPIRPDCELQTAFGHLIKGTFLIYIIFQVIKYKFHVSKTRPMLKANL